MAVKPRYRVPAGRGFTADGYQNFLANVGLGTNTQAGGFQYGLTPITRNHVQLEFMYRGSWIVRQIVDAVADDMVRAGVTIDTDLPPDQLDHVQGYWNRHQIWKQLNSALKWSRLYGGCLAVIMIDGQRPETPLRLDTVGRGQFKGLMILDRWMVWPHVEEPILEQGPRVGEPKFYSVVADARGTPRMKIHYTRVIRFDGVDLPYWQKTAENGWSLSVVEPMLDRLVHFDSSTLGVGQLVYKAHLRTLKLPKLRQAIAMGGPAYDGIVQFIQTMRLMQSNEGITLLDAEDTFETHQYSFAGLSDVLIQFGQQLSGACQIPLTRLFGQAPAGLSSTGESDMRNYYDSVNARQRADLHDPVRLVYDLCSRSQLGRPLPKNFDITFNPLWQLSEPEKASTASTIAQTIFEAVERGLIDPQTALRELRQQSRLTGVFSNVTDEMIAEAQDEPVPAPPAGGEEQQLGQPDEGAPESAPADAPEVPADTGDSEDEDPGRHVLALHFAEDRAARATREVHGLTAVIETPKGSSRTGYNWTSFFPCDYGYLSGTNSAEGPQEQTDVFIGEDETSPHVWIMEQVEPSGKLFDEYKVFCHFRTREAALNAHASGFSDGSGPLRQGRVVKTDGQGLRDWLVKWKYGAVPPRRSARLAA